MLTIRNARPEDFTFINNGVRDVDRLYRQMKELPAVLPHAQETFNRMLKNNDHHCILVAEHKNQKVGAVAVAFSDALHFGGLCAEIQDIFVDPKARGLGVGKALLQRVKEIAIERDAASIDLMAPPPGSEQDDVRSRFYEECGYKLTGVARSYVLHDDMK
ncbi:acetyltransferase, GNAT family protein [Tritrichomonas foetus]|uniref:Acetyltransferase, GNAT family protein n=1 Tax=Tritrichomonas foetus TaxID=1144522 RepID=A0A1J4KUQ6_9EUKA|nr:acetyltransferase, GNAT family protein [Tritrichomonas foetus]|eukprot:OHT15003.1 acetyltransferase, GNAT family protein [Tritrichomonas foetus]